MGQGEGGAACEARKTFLFLWDKRVAYWINALEYFRVH